MIPPIRIWNLDYSSSSYLENDRIEMSDFHFLMKFYYLLEHCLANKKHIRVLSVSQ